MSDLAARRVYTGKVRDLYEVDDDTLLMVASDRLSAFDVVMAETIPDKGRVLTGLTSYWMVTCDPTRIEGHVAGFAQHPQWHGRAMLVRRAQMLPIECIVRGRLAGQAYDEYVARGTVHEMRVAKGMALTDPFPVPMFTPSTKAEVGHDLNISLEAAATIIGSARLDEAKSICLDLFSRAAKTLESVGLILADTKFELGVLDGRLVVCDEVVTPDSSRIWPADEVRSGETPPSFDKQPFRDWLSTMPWDRTPPPPAVPEEIVAITRDRYVAAYERVTGRSLSDWYGS